MKSPTIICFISILAGFALFVGTVAMAEEIALPKPSYQGAVTVEEALRARRTHRSFTSRALTVEQLSQMVWAAYGVTAQKHGLYLKTAPSAGALYPLDIYAVVGDKSVQNIAPGVYHFFPEKHAVNLIKKGDFRSEVARNSLHQMWMAQAPLMVVITGEYQRSSRKYGPRGITYTHIEAGCAAQNIFLQAEAIGLKAGIVGAFNNQDVVKTMGLPSSHDPLLIMPVGFVPD